MSFSLTPHADAEPHLIMWRYLDLTLEQVLVAASRSISVTRDSLGFGARAPDSSSA